MPGKRELIEPHKGDKRFVRRNDNGRFSERDDAGKSLAQDVRTPEKPWPGRARATEATARRTEGEGALRRI